MITASIVLILFDLALTLFAVRRWGAEVEYNPVWRRVMKVWGFLGFAAMFILFWGGVLTIATVYGLVFIILISLLIDTLLNLIAIRSQFQRRNKSMG